VAAAESGRFLHNRTIPMQTTTRQRIAVFAFAAALLGVLLARMTEELMGPSPCAVRPPDWTLLPPPPQPEVSGPPLRVVVYNVHIGMGARWRPLASRMLVERNLAGIAAAIHRATAPAVPDVVALNEADFESRRSAWVDQPAFIAAELERLTGEPYRVVYGTTWTRDIPGMEVHFGNAALVRRPIRSAESCIFGGPCLDVLSGEVLRPLQVGRWFGEEPRSVLRVTLDVEGRPVDVLVSHLEAFAAERRAAQALELTRRFLRPGTTSILLGDLNATDGVMLQRRVYGAYDPTLELLDEAGLLDARVVAAARAGADDLAPWATFPSDRPTWPLDAVFATTDLVPLAVDAIGDAVVSDHLGLRVRYGWLDEAGQGQLTRWIAALRRQAAACMRFPRPA
jgi:endonuclease/exonuclease/phosphatase family metal-dependent hydrolase